MVVCSINLIENTILMIGPQFKGGEPIIRMVFSMSFRLEFLPNHLEGVGKLG